MRGGVRGPVLIEVGPALTDEFGESFFAYAPSPGEISQGSSHMRSHGLPTSHLATRAT